MSFTPTSEQQAAIDAFRIRGDMVLEAGAGTGKTSTLKLLAAELPMKRGLYLAYNSAIAREAKGSFPSSVETMTAHSLGYRWLNRQWGSALRERLNAPRVPAYETAKRLGANQPLIIGGSSPKVIQPNQQTSTLR